MTNPNRLAYLYFGQQAKGGYFQWPGMDAWCSEYDPRLRPWYAIAASGPKDIVLVVDMSGSMREHNRWTLAKQALEAVLKMTTEGDYVAIVGFNDGETDVANTDGVLWKMTQENREKLLDWLDWSDPFGGTNFLSGLNKAFEMIDRSVQEGHTSGCSTAVLFLTDGDDKSGLTPAQILQEVRTKNDRGDGQLKANLFTYSFGAESDNMLPKKLACQNKGVWHKVFDNGKLADVMTSTWYQFYTQGGPEADRTRWVLYEDIVTGMELLSACMPVHHDDTLQSELYGVVCLDLNLIISIPELRRKGDEWEGFLKSMNAMNAYCVAPVERTENEFQNLRTGVDANSACTECDQDDACDSGYDFVWTTAAPLNPDEDSTAFAVPLVLWALGFSW